MRPARVLVLASRQALEVVGPAADFALEAIGAERARMTDVSDALMMFDGVDVVLADVTRPSPAISYELGIAAAKGVPTVHVTSDPSKVSPVFGLVVAYDPEEAPSRIGYRFAKHLEDAFSSSDGNRVEGDAVRNARVEPETAGRYARGDVVEGPVVHVNGDAGFLLVRSGERRPAMLHVANMSPSLASAFEDGEVSVGDKLRAEVLEVDESRDQVQLRDVDGGVGAEPPEADQIAKLLRRWAGLEKVMGPGLRTRPDPGGPGGAFRRFLTIYGDDVDRARTVRNRVAHGETPSEEEVREAIETLDELRRVLRAEQD